jgi:hypothetical protein
VLHDAGMPPRARLRLLVVLAALASAAAAAAAGPSAIDGRWQSSFSHSRLLAMGAGAACADRAYGPWTARFGDGRYRIHNSRSGASGSGTFTIVGEIVRFVVATPVCDRSPSDCRASIYHGRLTFTNAPSGYAACGGWTTASWVRAAP